MDFGILALEVYFPKYYISQTDLEIADGCVGKYTRGLGQIAMGVCTVEEDINSICLTVLHNLVRRTNLDLRKVGFLEVGSETLIDKSKSTKTVLMQLFESCGNTDVEGLDCKNACFGGTAAVFHALNWLESSCWNGRLAVVVAGDIAIYDDERARPTGGAGAVAILLGPNAPLIIDPGLRAVHMSHSYDFYKPDLSSEYPIVDGQLSMQCYREALLICYDLYKKKLQKKGVFNVCVSSPCIVNNHVDEDPGKHHIDYVCFHAPFCRLVQKAIGWLAFEDARSACNQSNNCSTDSNHQGDNQEFMDPTILDAFRQYCTNETSKSFFASKEFDTVCSTASAEIFKYKVEPGLLFARNVGNTYTASLYSCLASILSSVPEKDLRNRRILMYSYGSGLASAMFSLTVHPTRPLSNVLGSSTEGVANGHSANHSACSIRQRLLQERTKIDVAQFESILKERQTHHNTRSFTPTHRPDSLFPGSYYLAHVDDKFRRTYKRMPQ